MVIFRSNFSVFLSFNTQLTHLNASNLLNFNPSNRFLPIASQKWCSGVSKMATYIYISCRFICSKIPCKDGTYCSWKTRETFSYACTILYENGCPVSSLLTLTSGCQ